MGVPYRLENGTTGAAVKKPAVGMKEKPKPSTAATASSIALDSAAPVIENPAFDPRYGSRGAVDANGKLITSGRSVIQRGLIMTADTNAKFRYAWNFQYNPQTFTHNSSVNMDVLIQDDDTVGIQKRQGEEEGGNWSVWMQNTGQSVSFSLILDRTYEVWGKQYTKTPASMDGVLTDVKVLYAMLGMYGTDKHTPYNMDQVNPKGVLAATPVWVIFSSSIAYYGIIQQCDVQFTHFGQDMTPIRATVGLSMMVMPKKDPVTRGWSSRVSIMDSKKKLSMLLGGGGSGTVKGPGIGSGRPRLMT